MSHFSTFICYIYKNQTGTVVLHFDALICNVSMRSVCVEFYGVFTKQENTKKKKIQNRIQKQTLNQESCASLRQVQLTYWEFTIPKHFFKLLQFAAQFLNVFCTLPQDNNYFFHMGMFWFVTSCKYRCVSNFV